MSTNKKTTPPTETESEAMTTAAAAATEPQGAETSAAEAAAPTAPAKPKPRVYEGITTFAYAGPSLPRGMLKNNAVLTGTFEEVTAYYKDALAEYPEAVRLIVPVARLSETKQKAQASGNIVHKWYNDIVAAIKKKNEQEE
jgi:hypothetical protein